MVRGASPASAALARNAGAGPVVDFAPLRQWGCCFRPASGSGSHRRAPGGMGSRMRIDHREQVMSKSLIATLAFGLAVFAAPAAAFTFTPGNIYAASEQRIFEFSGSGELLGTTYRPSRLRGIGFGPDGYLYVVNEGATFASTPSVDVLREDGSIVRTHHFTGSVGGNISYGKIAFDRRGENFYVGAGNGVYRFAIGGISGTLLVSAEAFDVSVLSNEDLFVATDSDIRRYSEAGVLLGAFSSLDNPLNLANAGATISLGSVRGVEHDARGDRTFITTLGFSSVSFQLFELVSDSNVLSRLENYTYADDVFVSDTGITIVGSRILAPGLFGNQLQFLGQLGSTEARFVTAIPEVLFSDGFEP